MRAISKIWHTIGAVVGITILILAGLYLLLWGGPKAVL